MLFFLYILQDCLTDVINILNQHKVIAVTSAICIIALFSIGGVILVNQNDRPIDGNKDIKSEFVTEKPEEDNIIKEDEKQTTKEIVANEEVKANQDNPSEKVSPSNNSSQQQPASNPKEETKTSNSEVITSQPNNTEVATSTEPVVTPVPEPVTTPAPEPVTTPAPEPVVTPPIKVELPNNYNIQYLSNYESEIIALVNQFRTENGVAALSFSGQLCESSRYKSNSIIQLNYFAHENPQYDNKNSAYLIKTVFNNPVSYCGENIHLSEASDSSMSSTALEIFTDWSNSPGHRANMLNPNYTKIGVGVVHCSRNGMDTIASTQHFSN